ncbi:putative hsc70-interacting protein [Monocercomonoides exilis]|uniref:putative hsc70-interacting protein n=1 Tax=Monocercomonoides exilis TaxID=2049356 RepID=UPI00355A2711|nr:putative hsc70-interacting protein [Monocercomonoides exilis]|eukprot:MONOS_14862.1-p1 / transcript=MONOS_14862.1 / gene=MONOS_14862 / organism=Monocercomonoides_exilis_PA203 / gene_product=Mitochondrial import receptor subunit TOM34 / transcript_product=Mitochondrial import receptor subunit TOM34 / location=Mono_scaffold01088:14730-16298(-) / protein_length=448 / sequence_SO=supercontig / SO=protein_coding / is_pseudo=false
MALPPKQLEELKAFVELIKQQPQILDTPQLSFFKDFLISWGAKIPSPPPKPKSQEPPKAESEPRPEPMNVEEESEESEESEEEPEEEIKLENPDLPITTPSEDDVPIHIPEEPAEVDYEKVAELKQQAVEARESGDLSKALDLITQVINLNPNSTINIGLRGQILLQMKRPLGALSDGEEAVKRNPDSAKGYLVRGKAKAMLGQFVEAYQDLEQAQRIDFNEEVAESSKLLEKKVQYLRAVEGRERRKADVKAAKERAKKLKEREKRIKEAQRQREQEEKEERERKAKKASEADEFDPSMFAGMGGGMPGGMGGMGGMPGMGGMGGMGGMPGMGGMGGMGGMPGMGGMGGMPGGAPGAGGMPNIDINDPELQAALNDKEFRDAMSDPSKLMGLMSNPKYSKVMTKLLGAMGGMGGGMGGGMPMGGMGGMPGMGGMGGMGGFPGMGGAK